MSEQMADDWLASEQLDALERVLRTHISLGSAETRNAITKPMISGLSELQFRRAEAASIKPILDVLSELSQRRQASAGLHDWDLAQSRGKFADHIERLLDAYDALNPKEESE